MRQYMGQSFIAQLDAVGVGSEFGMVTVAERITSGRSGWLRLDPNHRRAVELRFDYLGKAEDSFHYTITGAESAGRYASAALGVSVNGYVGLYHFGEIEGRWTIHYSEDEQSDIFTLLDSHGNTVGVTSVPFLEPGNTPDVVRSSALVYMSARASNIAQFGLSSIRVLV